jgi:hypothetical protein
VRAVGQRLKPADGVAAQPAVHSLAADAVALGDLDHGESVTQDLHDGVAALFDHCELQEHGSRPPRLDPGGRSRGRQGGGVNHHPELRNPSAGIRVSSIYRTSTGASGAGVPDICQKLRDT